MTSRAGSPGSAPFAGYKCCVQAGTLAEAADGLYALPPGGFREARDALAGQARTAGDRDLAKAIGRLRRPTVSAWLVNQLVREAGDQLNELLELGADLRDAQSALAGDRLRELSGRRRELVAALTQQARLLAQRAQQPVSEQAERELAGTLEAALADPAAEEAVRSGRLTSALSYAGLGEAGLPEVVAAAGAAAGGRQPAGQQPALQETRTARRDTRTAQQETRTARQDTRTAQQETRTARRDTRTAQQDTTAARPDTRTAEREDQRDTRAARAAEREARAAGAARRGLAEAEAAARAAADTLAGAEQQAATMAGQHQAARQRISELERELAEAQAAGARAARAASEARREREAAARSLRIAQQRLARARERGRPAP